MVPALILYHFFRFLVLYIKVGVLQTFAINFISVKWVALFLMVGLFLEDYNKLSNIVFEGMCSLFPHP